MEETSKIEHATFAAGCFWGVEEAFRAVPGVTDVEVGYTGGTVADPNYEQVCTGTTGHAEAVHVTFDPEEVSYGDLLRTFWQNHDPTTRNRQGPDVGTQYRSAIFTHSTEQQKAAEGSRDAEQKKYESPITTQIVPAKEFYRAEEYHQQYFAKNGGGACHI